eukprot:TRINITY_DN87277_c0_g1_i1.p1 TRINITY_DN87277_c0_g1~~TRINITY_DN87277_c0_g1_i1.p1  ORF type:complete len:194 (-),score=11.80 TRINITY_DN87277_c0_g1_i1:154-735(-)
MGGKQSSTILDGVTLPPNFSWVEEGKLAGCGLPQSNEELQGLAKLNIGLVVTLTEKPVAPGISNTGVEFPLDLLDGDILEKLKLLHVPCPDGCPPPPNDLYRCVSEMEICLSKGKAVVAHCYAGEGRAGTCLASFIAKTKKMEGPEAISHLRSFRPRSLHNQEQENGVQAYVNLIKKIEAGEAEPPKFESLYD